MRTASPSSRLADLQVFKECKPDLPGTPLYAGGRPASARSACTTGGLPRPATSKLTDVHTAGTGVFSFGAVTRSQGSCNVPANPQNGSGTITCALGRPGRGG